MPCRDAGRPLFSVGDALAISLVRPGGVVVLLILGQDGEQVLGAEDQHPVQEFVARCADVSLAGRVHPRSLNSGAQDRDASGLEDRIERGREVGAAVTDQEPEAREPLIQIQGQVAGLLHSPCAGRVRGDAAQVHPAGAVLNEYQYVQSPQQDRVNVQEVDGQDPGGLGVQELAPCRA